VAAEEVQRQPDGGLGNDTDSGVSQDGSADHMVVK
jgi:hypothetical protein